MPYHAALVLSGAYRTLPDCNASVVRHIINANPEVRFHVYAHLTTEAVGTDVHARHAIWNSFPCTMGAALETNAAVSAGVRADISGTEKLPRGRGTAQGKAMNIIKMFRGIQVAQRLLEYYAPLPQQTQQTQRQQQQTSQAEAIFSSQQRRAGARVQVPGQLSPPPPGQHGPRCGSAMHAPRAGYDLVIRLRPDLCFCGPLDLTPLLTRPGGAHHGHHVWLPWWSAQVGWAFDQIAVGPPAEMASYARGYESTVRRLVGAKTELYPEAVLWEHLASLGPAARLLRPLRGFHASLARSSPRFHLVDPYSKLKQDMAVVLPAASATLPSYACQREDDATNRTGTGHAARSKRRGGPGAAAPELRRARYRRQRQRQA